MQPYELTATEAAQLIGDRKLSCEELTRSCLTRIAEREPVIKAWAFTDPDASIRQARELDNTDPQGPLYGLPVGLKDIIETEDMPTSHNSPLYFGRHSRRDANCVKILKQSGAVMLGKTETVEFACGGRKALTRNPYNLAHTPGGSSSGSAAAVADMHLPLAIGTQTGGSVIRPAAFDGLYAIKPTFGLVSREGVKEGAPSLDTLGWFARCASDLSLVAKAFRFPGLSAGPSVRADTLRVGICKTPMWDKAGPGTHLALERARERLRYAGCEIVEFDLPEPFDRLSDATTTIIQGENRVTFLSEYLTFGAKLHEYILKLAEDSFGITPEQMVAAYDLAGAARAQFERLLREAKLDCLVAPAAPDEAPEGLHSTGDSIFNGMWTLLHMPCIAIPVGRGKQSLPVGIEIIGPRYSDARLLGIAESLAPVLDVEKLSIKS